MGGGMANPFYLLGSQSETGPEGEPNGEMDLAAHFKIKTIHDAVVAKQPTSYLRNAPEFLNKTKMYKGDAMCLRTLMQQTPTGVKVEQLGKDYLRKYLLLTPGVTELAEEDLGTLVEGEGWGQGETAPSSRETSQGKADAKGGIIRSQHVQPQALGAAQQQQEQHKEASTKIRIRIGGGVKEKNRKGKKSKREKKDKDKERKKPKRDRQE